MRVLYLTYDGLTDPLGRSQVLPYLEGLSQGGAEITVVSFEKKRFSGSMDEVRDVCAEAGIHWLPLTYHKEPPILSSLYDIRRMRRTVKQLIRDEVYQLCHCRSYIPAMVGLELKREQGIPFLFDMRGFWADERVEGGLWDLRNPIFKAVFKKFKKLEREFFAEADHVVCLTEASIPVLRDRFGVTGPSVIPTCVDMELFAPRQREKKELFTLGYTGSWGTWYMTEAMMRFFHHLLKKRNTVRFRVITRDDPAALMAEVERLGIPGSSVEVLAADRSEVPGLMAGFDAMVMFISPVSSKVASCPTKLGEALAMNIPVVVNKGVGDVEAIVTALEAGIVVTDMDDASLSEAASQLLEWKGTDTRKGIADRLSLDWGVKAYLEAYSKTVSGS